MRVMSFVMVVGVVLSFGCGDPDRPEARGFALPAGDVERGKQAFTELRCYSCHVVDGLEDELPRPTATPVTDVPLGGLAMREPTDGELVTAIINPSRHMYPAEEPERVTSGAGSRMANLNEILTAQQLIDLVAFLHDRYRTAEPETD